jgi:hypothetical protein
MNNRALPSNQELIPFNFSDEQAWFIRQRQIWAMASLWPEFEILDGTISLPNDAPWPASQETIWIGPIQPSELSKVYLTEVHFIPAAHQYPYVKIIDPEIPFHSDLHMFLKAGNLCLFDSRLPLCVAQSPHQAYLEWMATGVWPGNPEWNVMSLIADTTIPWTAEWLFYYEAWVITGEWLGGGHRSEDVDIPRSMKLQLELHRLRKKTQRKLKRLNRRYHAG